MANKTTPATAALNEEDYINKLYDHTRDKQKQMLMDAYSGNQESLNREQQSVQQQTDTSVERTNVESQKVADDYRPQNVSESINPQAELAMQNQQRQNVKTLRDAQSDADYELERQRQLLGQQYAAAIKKAQADNDMARAQQLYAEAKAKEEEFRALRGSAANLLAAKGDNSILRELASGTAAGVGASGETADAVLKHEDSINRIYDSANESSEAQAQMTLNAMLSQIRAERDAKTRDTDRRLTQTYADALRRGKNYDEIQAASGLGSGNLAQARLARALGTTEDLTALRGVQIGADAALGQQRFGAEQAFRDSVLKSTAANEQSRAAALLKAASDEEQNMVDAQLQLGKQLAANGNYSVLGALYGLTQDQIDRLQGTGAYAPKKRKYTPQAPKEETPEEKQEEAEKKTTQEQILKAYEERAAKAPVVEPWLNLLTRGR